MAGKILVVTPHATLGHGLRHHLEQGGQRQVSVAASSHEAALLDQTDAHDVVILDGDLTQPTLERIASQLRRQHPGVRILALPPTGNPNRPPFAREIRESTNPDPSTFDELIRYLDRLLPVKLPEPGPVETHPGSQSPSLPDLEERPDEPQMEDLALQTSRRLEARLASSGARAVFLYTQGQLLSFPVELPGEQTAAVAGCLQAYLSREGHADLVRYLAWTPDPTPDLLYAARFTQGQEEDGQGPALLFDGQVPLSRARSQVHAFVQDLESLDGFPRPPSMAGLLFPSPQPEEASPSGIGAAHDTISAWVREADGAPVASPPLPMDPVEASEEGSPEDGAVLSEPGLPAEQAWIPPEMRASGSLTNRERSPKSDGAASLLEFPSAAAGVTQEISEIRLPVMEAFLASEDVGLPVPVPPVFAIETLPQTKDRLDPVTTNVYNLAYTGLFIPRLPHHFLTRDLADAAGRIFQHICLAYGWRLEALSVRREYIQWIVRTSPSIAPNTLLKVLHQRSSQVIFETYPDLRQDNPSGDFWAPGYLILSGVHAPSTGLVREFILQTRHRQGIQAS